MHKKTNYMFFWINYFGFCFEFNFEFELKVAAIYCWSIIIEMNYLIYWFEIIGNGIEIFSYFFIIENAKSKLFLFVYSFFEKNKNYWNSN